MIRPFTVLCLLAACGSGLYLYSEKHRTALLDRDIGRVIHATEAARARTGILRAEWALLNEPGRLQDMAGRYLTLHPMAPTQFVQLAELSTHLPAPIVTPPGGSTDDEDTAGDASATTPGAPTSNAATPLADLPVAAAEPPAAHPALTGKADGKPGHKVLLASAGSAAGHPRPQHHVTLADRETPSHDGLMTRGTPLPLAAPQPMGASVFSAMAHPMRYASGSAAHPSIVSAVPSYPQARPYVGSALGGGTALPPPFLTVDDGRTPTAPPSDAPPPARRRGTEAARLRGAPESGAAMPRMETVRITAPDLARRAALDRTRNRLVFAAGGFFLLFGAVAAKLTSATVIYPMAPSRAEMRPLVPADPGPSSPDSVPMAAGAPHTRATILDRNGEILAISLPTAALFANPKEMIDTVEAAHKLKQVLPRMDEKAAAERLASAKQFVYLERQITPNEELAINALGIPGVYFQPGEKRRYPLGRVAAQVLGGVDVDSHGVAGAERAFDHRLETDNQPVRLSIDVRVQGVVRDELEKSKEEFHAIGACGIVMDVRTGEVIAMVSLPDYDANQFGETPPDDRFNRAVTGMFEPGSTFKLQTAAMAMDFGTAHIWDQFDAAHNIHIGRFTIVDYKGKHRFLYLPEVLAYSSNLGAAHVALGVGAQRQMTWLQAMGMFKKVGIELPEAGWPIVPPRTNWKEATTMTVGFGHGIAVSPLHVVRGTAALANGGVVLQPTILAHDPSDPLPEGRRIMNASTSNTIRKMMRLVVTDGYGKPADIEGYFVGGKTGTAEKVGAHGYKKHANVSAFMSVFPMNSPRYAVYFMLDEPVGNKETGGYATAGAVSAPGAGRVIARIAPMLGLFPQIQNEATIQAGLSIPMQPARGSGEPTGTGSPLDPPAPPPAATVSLPATPARRDLLALRHEAALIVRVPEEKRERVADGGADALAR